MILMLTFNFNFLELKTHYTYSRPEDFLCRLINKIILNLTHQEMANCWKPHFLYALSPSQQR